MSFIVISDEEWSTDDDDDDDEQWQYRRSYSNQLVNQQKTNPQKKFQKEEKFEHFQWNEDDDEVCVMVESKWTLSGDCFVNECFQRVKFVWSF